MDIYIVWAIKELRNKEKTQMNNYSAYWEILVGLCMGTLENNIKISMWNLDRDIAQDIWVKEQKEDSQLKKKEKGRANKGASEVTTGNIS